MKKSPVDPAQHELFAKPDEPITLGEQDSAIPPEVTPSDPSVRDYWNDRTKRAAHGVSLRGEDTGAEIGHPNPDLLGAVVPADDGPHIGDVKLPGQPDVYVRSRNAYEMQNALSAGRRAVKAAGQQQDAHRKKVEEKGLDGPDFGAELIRSNPFFRALNLETIGEDVDQVLDNTAEDKARVEVESFEKATIGIDGKKVKHTVDGVLLSGEEYRATVGHGGDPERFTSMIASVQSKQLKREIVDIDQLRERVQFEVGYALDGKIKHMEEEKERLEEEIDLLVRTQNLLNAPGVQGGGYAKLQPEHMKANIVMALDVFESLLNVIAKVYEWDKQDKGIKIGARKAMLERLFTGEPEAKQEYWNQMLEFFMEYDRKKITIMRQGRSRASAHKRKLEFGYEADGNE